ncbi:CLIP-associated protein-like [Carex rostrata]
MRNQDIYAANCYQSDEETSINQILNQVCTGNSRNSNLTKLEAIHQLVEISKHKGNSVWFKIVNQAQRCLNVVISQYEPLRCLAAIRPLLVCEDEKLLIVCTNSLAKIICRFSQEDLMTQLLSFVPSLHKNFWAPYFICVCII